MSDGDGEVRSGSLRPMEEVSAEIDAEVGKLRDRRVVTEIQALLVTPPTPIRLSWDYGAPGEAFDGWLVFRDPTERTGIAYCSQGFGPRTPWGLVFMNEPFPSIGMDCGWFPRFLDAYFDSFSATALPIWRVARRNKDTSVRTLITDELSWREAWTVVERMRKEDPGHRYDCEHDIPY
jgi:hypothetical protein